MRYKNQSKILIVFSAFLVIILTSCAMMLSAKNKVPDKVENKALSDPPKLTITVNGQNIYNEMGKREWNGAKFKRMDPFEYMAKNQKLKDLPYVSFNSFIELSFDGIRPDDITISDMIIDQDGKRKYSEKEIMDIPFDIKNDKGFTLSGHMASMLSSNSEDYKPGAVIRGFLIVCSFGENKCDYAFALRTDAGVTTSKTTENLSDIEKTIDKNLDIIMSSPKEASSPNAYINAHKKEYDEIISLSDAALPHLYSIYETEKGLRSLLCEIAMFKIKPDLNIKSAVSPGKFNQNYRIETYGIDFENPISGLYPANEIRLVDTNTGETLWGMAPGYLKTDFAWSQDGRYVAISYMARIYSETIVLDTTNMSLVYTSSIDEVSKKIDAKYAPREDRADPYFWLFKWKWTDESTPQLQINFNWVSKDDRDVEGGFIFDIEKNDIIDIYADFVKESSTIDFKDPDKLEIKYNYSDYFGGNNSPFTTSDKDAVNYSPLVEVGA